MSDYRRLAHRGVDWGKGQDRLQHFLILNLPKGPLAICRLCPRYHVDIRKVPHPVWSQSYPAKDAADAAEWFAAHQCTDMHQHYLNQPCFTAPLRARSRAQRKGEGLATGKPVPFPHGVDRRNLPNRGKREQ